MKYLLTSFALFTAIPSFAALSPYYDAVEQFKTVLDSTDLAKQVRGKIINIESKGKLLFSVETDLCRAQVILDAHFPKAPIVGPVTYTVKSVDKVDCE